MYEFFEIASVGTFSDFKRFFMIVCSSAWIFYIASDSLGFFDIISDSVGIFLRIVSDNAGFFFIIVCNFFFSGVWRPVDRPLPHQPIQGQGSRIQGLCWSLIKHFLPEIYSVTRFSFFLFIRLLVFFHIRYILY